MSPEVKPFPTDHVRLLLDSFSALRSPSSSDGPLNELTSAQAGSVRKLYAGLKEHQTMLLHGETGTGKTVLGLLTALVWRYRDPSTQALIIAPSERVRDERWHDDYQALAEAAHQTAITTGFLEYVAEAPKNQRLRLATASEVRAGKVKIRKSGLAVLDEAHRRTDEDTVTGDAIRKALLERHVLTLTATPLRRSADDLAGILSIGLKKKDQEALEPISAHHEAIHEAIRMWWRLPEPLIDNPAMKECLEAVDRTRVAAQTAYRARVITHRATAAPTPPCRHDVAPDKAWLRGYALARTLPAVLHEAGFSSETNDRNEADSLPRPSDRFRRALLSSNAATLRSAALKPIVSKDAPDELKRLYRILRDDLDPTAGAHPKVAATAKLAIEAARNTQVLIFTEFHASAPEIAEAIRAKSKRVRVHLLSDGSHAITGKSAAGAISAFRKNIKGHVLIATPMYQESIELDQEIAQEDALPRLLILHDTPWSAVEVRQRQGRLSRARNGFPPIDSIAPILDLPDDDRIWQTMRGRWNVADLISEQDDRVEPEGPGTPNELPEELLQRLQLM
jgi:hypothetical protein